MEFKRNILGEIIGNEQENSNSNNIAKVLDI
jgi:hypothetical protein